MNILAKKCYLRLFTIAIFIALVLNGIVAIGSAASTLIYPSAYEYVTLDASNSLTFNWTAVDGATNYHLEVSRYSDFHTLTRDRTTTNTYYYVAVEQNATYYWRVSAYVNGSWEDPSNYSVFYTFEDPEPETGNSTYLTIGPSGCNYTVDGDDDQVQINQALAAVDALGGGVVELVGPFTYDITGTILIGDDTTLISTTGAVIRLNDDCMWNSMVPVIGQLDGTYTATHDVEICGLEFDCNEANLTHLGTYDSNNLERKWGKGFYNTIYIRGGTSEANFAYNISIHDNHFYDGMGDSARIFNARNFTYYANEAENMQHATVYCAQVLGADIYDNEIEHITNAGIRFDNSEDAIIHGNILRDYTGTTSAPKYGSEGIQIGNQDAISRLTNNITIYDNDIQGGLDAIQLMDALGTAGTTAQTVLIYNNTIHDSGICTWAKYNGAISVWNWGNGLTIYHNQINDSYGAGILVYNAYSGCTMDVYENNIVGVYDTLATDPTYQLGVTGYGILNYIGSAYMDVNATSNYITGCSTGAYYGVTPTSTASEPNVWEEEEPEGTDEAYFTCDVTSGAAPLTVNFTDASTNATVYEWTIVREGADFIGVSYEQNPTYTFGEAGNYTVTLDTDTDSYSTTITVTDPEEEKFNVDITIEDDELVIRIGGFTSSELSVLDGVF